ncbi:MAG TPA: hypothetical protein VFJ82_16580 [Longimicrobium sp.]|nr:hypothetical protein [Longimicrobium sp.]
MDPAAVLLRHRSTLERALPAAAVLLTIAAVLAGFLVEAGPARRFVVFYLAPLVLVFPLWARARLRTLPAHPGGRIALDAAVVIFATLRTLTGALPFSGHMLFLTYSILTTRVRWYLAVAALLIAETTWFKLVVWHDLASWSIGLAAGLACAGVYALLGRWRAGDEHAAAARRDPRVQNHIR